MRSNFPCITGLAFLCSVAAIAPARALVIIRAPERPIYCVNGDVSPADTAAIQTSGCSPRPGIPVTVTVSATEAGWCIQSLNVTPSEAQLQDLEVEFNMALATLGAVNVTNITGTVLLSSNSTVNVQMVPLVPRIVSQPMGEELTAGQDTTFSGGGLGFPPLTFQWFSNSVPIPDATNMSYSVTNVTVTDGATYSMMVSNSFGIAISSNAILTVLPPYAPRPAVYSGVILPTNSAAPVSGAIQIATSTRSGISGFLQLDSKRFPFTTSLDIKGRGTVYVGPNQSSPFLLLLQADLFNGETVTGQIDYSGHHELTAFCAYRHEFDSRTNPCPQAGNYTWVMPGNSGTGPGGYSYGTVLLKDSGAAVVKGMLSDRTRFVQTTCLCLGGRMPFFDAIKVSNDRIVGEFDFNSTTEEDLNGALFWSYSLAPGMQSYGNGFTNEAAVAGSIWVPSRSGSLPFTHGTVIFSGNDLSSSLTNQITMGNPINDITGTNRLRMTLDRNGIFEGTVTLPGMRVAVPFGGAILQKQQSGFGCFSSPGQSGSVILTATP